MSAEVPRQNGADQRLQLRVAVAHERSVVGIVPLDQRPNHIHDSDRILRLIAVGAEIDAARQNKPRQEAASGMRLIENDDRWSDAFQLFAEARERRHA
jgi:hypothetical protein